MKELEELEDIEGKTVKEALFINCDETAIIKFVDDTFIALRSKSCYGDAEIEVKDDLDKDEEYSAGIITDEEYEKWEEKCKISMANDREKEERQTLKELKEKYE